MSHPAKAATRSALVSALVVAGVALALVLIGWAAVLGPQTTLRGDGPSRVEAGTLSPTASTEPTAGALESDRAHESGRPGRWLAVVVTGLGVLGLAAGLVVLGLLVVALARSVQVHRRDPVPEAVEFDPLTAPEALTRRLAGALPEHEAALRRGPPGEGIIACWQEFQRVAEEHGVARRAAETSSEFTLRVLDALSTDGDAVSGLARLYREARFSDHRLGEDDRAAALDAVRRIHAGLRGVGADR